MNEISKKRKLSIDLNVELSSQCKKVNLMDDKNNLTQKDDFDFPDMDFDFLEVRQFIYCI